MLGEYELTFLLGPVEAWCDDDDSDDDDKVEEVEEERRVEYMVHLEDTERYGRTDARASR